MASPYKLIRVERALLARMQDAFSGIGPCFSDAALVAWALKQHLARAEAAKSPPATAPDAPE